MAPKRQWIHEMFSLDLRFQQALVTASGIETGARVKPERGNLDPATASGLPFVSVVTPVFNDLEGLASCLKALDHQTYPGTRYEIVVVDNGSDKHLEPFALASRYTLVRTDCEPRPGSYAARNRGVRMARGEIIAFTDADCIPAEDWLEMGVRQMMQRPELGLVAGEIDVVVGHMGPPTAVEIYEKAVAFDPRRLLSTQKYGVTANLFTSRGTLDRVGLFDERLKSGADLEWGRRVHEIGLEQVFAADARVTHLARSSFADLYQRSVRFAGGKYDLSVATKQTRSSRLIHFLMMVSWDVIAIPLAFMFHCSLDRRVRGPINRFKYAGVSVWVRSVEIGEKVRLYLGKPSSRR